MILLIHPFYVTELQTMIVIIPSCDVHVLAQEISSDRLTVVNPYFLAYFLVHTCHFFFQCLQETFLNALFIIFFVTLSNTILLSVKYMYNFLPLSRYSSCILLSMYSASTASLCDISFSFFQLGLLAIIFCNHGLLQKFHFSYAIHVFYVYVFEYGSGNLLKPTKTNQKYQ